MCGIAGLIGNGRISLDRGIVAKMLSEIEHRGPDASGIWSSDSAVLGGARLSIVDLDAGPQPILNESKSLQRGFSFRRVTVGCWPSKLPEPPSVKSTYLL